MRTMRPRNRAVLDYVNQVLLGVELDFVPSNDTCQASTVGPGMYRPPRRGVVDKEIVFTPASIGQEGTPSLLHATDPVPSQDPDQRAQSFASAGVCLGIPAPA